VPLAPGLFGAAGLLPLIWFASEHQPIADGLPPRWDAPIARAAALIGFSNMPLLTAGSQRGVRQRFLAYSATILSFIGAVHWGIAMAAPAPPHPSRYAVSILPAIVAWKALDAEISAQESGREAVMPYVALCVGHVGMFLYDEAAAASGNAPKWYPALRAPLTFVTLGATCAAFYLGREPRSRRAV
jgi:hypothetical protein